MVSDSRLRSANTSPIGNAKKRGWWESLNLQTKATIFAVAIATIPVILVGSIGYTVVNRSIEEKVIESEKSKALEISDKINRFMFERYGDILTLSNLEFFTDPKLKITLDQKAAVLERFTQTYVYDSINIINLDRSMLVQNTKGTIPKGFIYKKGTEGIEYLEEVFKSDKPVIGFPAPAVVTRKFSLFAAAPIKVNGVTNSIIRSRIPVAKLGELLKNFLTEGGNYSIVDGRTSKIFSSSNPKEFGLVDKDRFPVMNQVLASNIPTAQIVTVDGEENLIAYVKLPELKGLPNLNWLVVVSTPTRLAFAAQRVLLINVLLGTAITAILASILATAIARRATKPIIEATEAVSKLGKGELETRLVVEGEDEISQLSGNINLMASQLQNILEVQASEVRLSDIQNQISLLADQRQFKTLVESYMNEIKATFGCDRVVIYEFDAELRGRITQEVVEKNWTSAYEANLSDPCIPKVLIDGYLAGRVVATGDVFNAGFDPEHLGLMRKLEIKSNLVAPIRREGQLYGLLIAHHCQEQHSWRNDETAYLKQAGEQLGRALRGMELSIDKQVIEAQKKQRAMQLQILSEVSQARNNLGLDIPLSEYLAELRQELQSDRIVVYRFTPDNEGKTEGVIVAESKLAHLGSAKDAGLSDPCIPVELLEAYKNGRVKATADVFNAGLSPLYVELMVKLQVKSNVVVPILRAGELDGLLIAHACDRQREWQPEEVKLLQQQADEIGRVLGGLSSLEQQTAIAIQERQRSEQLQTSLISLLGDVEGAASGDLTVRAQITADDIGIVADFFNAIIESLRDVVSQVKLSATQVNSSVGDNDVAIRQLAEEAIAQTNQITDTLQSIEEMTLSIQQVAKSAGQAADASLIAANTAELGGIAMAKTVSSIMELRSTVAETAKKVKRLGESSQQISKVVALIDQIALKTNMLAVNASIEAARAGEEGKGFAIVAEEVGALAAQSTSATKEIERIVESIQRETGEVVEAMEASTSQVVEGTKQVEEAKQSLGQILAASRQVNELFQSISIATTSQVNISEVVKKLMTQVALISQRSSSTSKEVSQALQETVEITKQLQESVGAFKVS